MQFGFGKVLEILLKELVLTLTMFLHKALNFLVIMKNNLYIDISSYFLKFWPDA